MDAPESVHPDGTKNVAQGKIASEYTKAMLEGKEGYAQIATFPPNVKYVAEFMELERIARENNKGLWTYEDGKDIEEQKEEIKPEQQSQNHINDSLIVSPGEDTRATIEGTPGVEYRISVYYSSGRSTAKGLENKIADENGNISWTWKVGSKTKPGQYKIVITGDKTVELILEVK